MNRFNLIIVRIPAPWLSDSPVCLVVVIFGTFLVVMIGTLMLVCVFLAVAVPAVHLFVVMVGGFIVFVVEIRHARATGCPDFAGGLRLITVKNFGFGAVMGMVFAAFVAVCIAIVGVTCVGSRASGWRFLRRFAAGGD
ncbi:hypothetical protein ACXYTJ_00265 [Gilvimarinus sp. F26214L]|uniref:hypothetical protein n=1 Tax=Gilvimarinus sp. DZF01 TaxID=3461371 RepID=UPI004045B615